jgi:hypothetical protein
MPVVLPKKMNREKDSKNKKDWERKSKLKQVKEITIEESSEIAGSEDSFGIVFVVPIIYM